MTSSNDITGHRRAETAALLGWPHRTMAAFKVCSYAACRGSSVVSTLEGRDLAVSQRLALMVVL